MSPTLINDLCLASAETLYMVVISTTLAVILGLPLGIAVFVNTVINPKPKLAWLLTCFINMTRSIPFIILLVALIPITRFFVGTSIGINAALVPLTLGAIPLFARLVDNALLNLPAGLIETGFSLGVSTWQMIRFIILPEALAPLIQAITMTAITLVNYSAMAGTVGGGGLGDLAIRYGYQRFSVDVILATVIILIIIVQLLQKTGDKLVRYFSH